MTEEEKEAIEEIKLQIQNDKEDLPYSEECIKYKQTILDLIEKQQKEIEELKIIASKFTNRDIDQFSIGEFNFKVKHFEENYISKDKIRDKIKEIIQGSSRFNVLCKINENEETIKTRYAVQVLEELLEEE